MKIILHADDFGYDADTCRATIDCFEKGYLTSATIMANMPATEMALSYARQHPEYNFGVHLTYMDNPSPLAPPASIPSLVNTYGRVLPSGTMRKKGLLLLAKKKDIITESLRQINALKEAGIPVSHLDSHGHIHKFPAFLSALKQVSKQTGIGRVRRVQNIHLHEPSAGLTSALNASFDRYIARHFTTTDFFYMAANCMDTHWSRPVLQQMASLAHDQTLEIGVHPGLTEEWRRHEYEDIREFAKSVLSEGHELINWNQL
ncbi:MAG: ChbG/HpnK family deacetylase [Bacteroides sp.]|nr:ChbG/HpnK family deacetylase [Bacteroides sp.]